MVQIHLLAPIEILRGMLSHADVKKTQIYTKTNDVIIRHDMAKLSEFLVEK